MKQRKKTQNNNVIRIFLGVVVSLFLFILLFYGSSLPYVGYNSWNFNIYSLIAHNYNSFGYFATKFAPVISVSAYLPENPTYYLNHPQLLSVLTSLVFRFFGETFLTGRLVNIFAAFLSCVWLSAIARELAGKKFAVIVFATSILIPASTLFGRMIGQESLVLFFALLYFYMFLLFDRTRRKKWLIVCTISVILGTLSDWAMVYFTVAVSGFLLYKKEKKIALLTVLLSITTAFAYIGYIYALTGDLSFLGSGFLNRSLGSLLQSRDWIVDWLGAIVIRLLVYFNPLFVILSLVYFFRYRNLENKATFIATLSLLLFAVIHIVLYPEGSYGHPYWMYYLFPSVALSSAVIMRSLWTRRRLVVLVGLVFSVIYVFSVVWWKTKETEGNIFRYDLAELASTQIPDYTPILINRSGPIDPDIFQYSFRHATVILEPDQMKIPDTSFQYVVFSCISSCNVMKQLTLFKKEYSGTRYVSKNLEIWVLTKTRGKEQSVKTVKMHITIPDSSRSFFSKIYQKTIQLSSAPQL